MKTREQAEAEANEIVEKWATRSFLTGWIPLSALFQTATLSRGASR